jgi:hypothetical protein
MRYIVVVDPVSLRSWDITDIFDIPAYTGYPYVLCTKDSSSNKFQRA